MIVIPRHIYIDVGVGDSDLVTYTDKRTIGVLPAFTLVRKLSSTNMVWEAVYKNSAGNEKIFFFDGQIKRKNDQ